MEKIYKYITKDLFIGYSLLKKDSDGWYVSGNYWKMLSYFHIYPFDKIDNMIYTITGLKEIRYIYEPTWNIFWWVYNDRYEMYEEVIQ